MSLTGSATNSVYVVIDPTAQDDVTVEAMDSGTPANPFLKIGEVDTSADTVSDVSRDPDGTFEKVSTDETASDLVDTRQYLRTSHNTRWSYIGRGTTIARLSDLSNWSVVSSDTTLTTGQEGFIGGTSAQLERSSGGQGVIRHTFGSPQDFSDKHLNMAVWVNIEGFVDIVLRDSNGGQAIYRRKTDLTDPINSWRKLDFGLSTASPPDYTDITEIDLRMSGMSPGDPVYFDDLRQVNSPDKAAVIISVDNPANDDNTLFYEVLSDYGIVGSAAISKNKVQEASNVDVDFLREMQADGWDIASKGLFEDLDGQTAEEQRQQIEENKRWLLRNGFLEPGINHYVYHQNNYNNTTLEIMPEYHDAAYSGASTTDSTQSFFITSPFEQMRWNIEGQLSGGEAQAEIDKAIDRNLASHLYFHTRNMTEQDYIDLCEKLVEEQRAGNIEVMTFSDYMAVQDSLPLA